MSIKGLDSPLYVMDGSILIWFDNRRSGRDEQC